MIDIERVYLLCLLYHATLTKSCGVQNTPIARWDSVVYRIICSGSCQDAIMSGCGSVRLEQPQNESGCTVQYSHRSRVTYLSYRLGDTGPDSQLLTTNSTGSISMTHVCYWKALGNNYRAYSLLPVVSAYIIQDGNFTFWQEHDFLEKQKAACTAEAPVYSQISTRHNFPTTTPWPSLDALNLETIDLEKKFVTWMFYLKRNLHAGECDGWREEFALYYNILQRSPSK